MKNVKNKIVWEHNTILLKIVYKKFVKPEKDCTFAIVILKTIFLP